MKKLIVASILAVSNFAFAEGDPTEFLYQAISGQKYIQGNLNYLTSTQDGDPSGELKISDLNITGAYEQGLSDELAVYGSLGYGQGEIEGPGDTADFNGLNPINLGAKYRMKLGMGQIYVQGNLGLGVLEKADENRTDGSINLSTRLGYIMTYDTAMAGLVLDLGLFSTDGEVDASGDDISKNSGLALSAFYEMVVNEEMILGYSATYASGVGFIGVNNNSPYGGVFSNDISEASLFDVAVYTRVPVSEKLQILGKVNYGFMIDQEADFLDGGSNIGVGAGIRYML